MYPSSSTSQISPTRRAAAAYERQCKSSSPRIRPRTGPLPNRCSTRRNLYYHHPQIRSLTHISMGSWDELCLLCGVYVGPCDIVSRYALDDVAKAIATDIRPNDPKLFEIIKEALLVSLPPAQRTIGYSPEWLPAGMGNNGYSSGAWVAVGHFDANGEAPLSHGRILDGRDVQVRRVQNGDGGEFTELLVADKHGEETAETTYSVCSVKREEGRPNFFLCERCYAYLDNWLDRESLPTSSRASGSDCELSLASELYEIVNSRKFQRGKHSLSGIGCFFTPNI
ncbi:hypothetical protein PHLGIDRAFT_448857 [Phlebiopsis gigantea 11061_1 CR5-6]|uniref:Uncharacterized protein n=1 Tax=Phlebiopsis gigantea (strain 11061_1 CR5-6) TaxID=745531 RepID=A0A0C3SA33_PHLG1|nr:hypothetical protein PHLGIDRAFT_448857 [Phlebiopsis gigantea 11061_1 CR5-6]